MTRDRAAAWTMAATLIALGAVAEFRQAPPPEPARQSASTCQPWMADALPGIGARTRDAAAAAIRSGDLASLPPAARARARLEFDFTR